MIYYTAKGRQGVPPPIDQLGELEMAILHIVRGIPGAGKTTFVKNFLKCYNVEADHFFMRDGVYTYDKNKIAFAHEFCYNAVTNAMLMGIDVSVSNTFVKLEHIYPYITIARKLGYKYEVVHVVGQHGSIHGVPEEVIERMKGDWQRFRGEFCVDSDGNVVGNNIRV